MNLDSQDFLINTIGMPVEHKRLFLATATQERCVIMVRKTGPTCHGPLSEGYDTKGYRIHGKSCDWGPMAGFVMRDPRLNKSGQATAPFNRAKHAEALVLDHEGQGWHASVTPLKISGRRIAWLRARGLTAALEARRPPIVYDDWIKQTNGDGMGGRSKPLQDVDYSLKRYANLRNDRNFEDLKSKAQVLFRAMGPDWKSSSRNRTGALGELKVMLNTSAALYGQEVQHGVTFQYALIPDEDGSDLFGVFFDKRTVRFIQEGREAIPTNAEGYPYGPNFEPMLAMTNPVEHRLHRNDHYVNAITGDYDLFAVWAFVRGKKKYDPSTYGEDHRPLGTVKGSVSDAEKTKIDRLERRFAAKLQAPGARPTKMDDLFEGTKLGNITPRIYMVCQLINSMVGRHVLWHSDEAARPHLSDMDLPIIAFTPAGRFIGIESVLDMKKFIRVCSEVGIRVTLSNAWTQEATDNKPNRLGFMYSHLVPADGERIIVPPWYNA